MAYVNVKDWSVDQVTDWLKGLDNVILQYTKSFLNNAVSGHQLLNLRADDLEHLGVITLGHQELILEAVEHLRNFHYELDKENLQMLALKLSCAANSLFRELLLVDEDCTKVQTQTMSDVHNIITTIKPLVCWLDRSPFRGDKDYMDTKGDLLKLSFEMATCAHRDIFSEKPVKTLRNICEKLARIGDHIIQEISDPMILQPASLDLTTLKKKEQDLGFSILQTYTPVHQIVEIKYGSPAHASSKIEEGDEIVQVNYQTVVGWQHKKVELLLQESPPEIVLTLKKRPRHTKVYGQIYMKPYRLPSKKRAMPYSRWNENLPSPRLLAIQDLPQIPPTTVKPTTENRDLETETSGESDCEGPDSPLDGGRRLYPIKPRPLIQRRHTIAVTTATSIRLSAAEMKDWQSLLKNPETATIHASNYNIETNDFDEDSLFLRDKSVSCSHGLELRPTTVIGIASNRKSFKRKSFNKKKVNFDETREFDKLNMYLDDKSQEDKSVSVSSLSSLSLTNDTIDFIDEGVDLTDRSKMKLDDINNGEIEKVNDDKEVFADVHIQNIIKIFNDQSKPRIFPRSHVNKPPDIPQKPDNAKKSDVKRPTIPPRNVQNRGKLDKSHSTPAYDLISENDGIKIDGDNLPLKHEYVEIPNEPTGQELIAIIQEEKKEVPPKPPPRTCTLDNYKPRYPAESPKPKNIAESPKLKMADSTKVKVLESSPKGKTIEQVNKAIKSLDNSDSHTNVTDVKLSTSTDTKSTKTTESLCTAKPQEKFYDNCGEQNKKFDPKSISTPINNKLKTESDTIDTTIIKNVSETTTKVSPTNSVVRAMIGSNKSKSVKKKNSLLAKRRKVNVNDVSPGEISGYLYQRLRNKQNQNGYWERRWFVLNRKCLYGFKARESSKAECFIYLSGFTVSIADEVKSRMHAFRVYHTGTIFYFSADDGESVTSWIENIESATFHDSSNMNEEILYSETDESDTEKLKNTPDKSSQESIKKFGSLKKFTSRKTDSTHSGSTSLDRKWFFNKSNTSKNSMPIPTAQFRSYRKIPASVSTGNFTSHIPDFASRYDIQQSVPNLTLETPKPCVESEETNSRKPSTTLSKPPNYVHQSNPSIPNNDFAVSHILPKSRPQHSENLAGFVTLRELMNRQSEERKLNPHLQEEEVPMNPNLIRPDVVYGVVPIRPKKEEKKSRHNRTSSDVSQKESRESSCFGKRSGSMKKTNDGKVSTFPKSKMNDEKYNRSLPRTHKLQESYWQDMEPCKSLTNLEERPYEMIYCPQTVNDVQFAQNRSIDKKMYQETPKKTSKLVKQHSLTSADKKSPYLDSFRRLDKVGDKSSSLKLKSAIQYTPMTLHITNEDKKNQPKLAFELSLDEKSTTCSSSKGGKLKSFFGKSDPKKEKSFLGSPKLHRAVFKRSNSDGKKDLINEQEKKPSSEMSTSMVCMSNIENATTVPMLQVTPPADYPGLEYPPVFEPETYSLADPQSSLTLLRKQPKNSLNH